MPFHGHGHAKINAIINECRVFLKAFYSTQYFCQVGIKEACVSDMSCLTFLTDPTHPAPHTQIRSLPPHWLSSSLHRNQITINSNSGSFTWLYTHYILII